MYIAKEMTEYSTTEIGSEFGGRDHTTVMHSIDKIKDAIKTDSSSKTASQKTIKTTNYVEEVLNIIEINLPGITVPEKLKTDLEAIFKIQGENHE